MASKLAKLIKANANHELVFELLYVPPEGKTIQLASGERIFVRPLGYRSMPDYKGETIGWGLWRKNWYSCCSAHRRYVYGCERCAKGRYIWCVRHFCSSLIYRISPNFWRRWTNGRRR